MREQDSIREARDSIRGEMKALKAFVIEHFGKDAIDSKKTRLVHHGGRTGGTEVFLNDKRIAYSERTDHGALIRFDEEVRMALNANE